MKRGIKIKTPAEIEVMREGGMKLARVKNQLKKSLVEVKTAYELDLLADELIKKEGAQSSFKKVPGYKWATCVNVNAGIVHGIPGKNVTFATGDLVSVDVGIYFKGFHTDTSFSVEYGSGNKYKKFLEAGKQALKVAIKVALPGNRIYSISKAIEDVLTKNKYIPIKALVGHGVGRDLHEDPQIPCFTNGIKPKDTPELLPGMVLAIEVMYTLDKPDLVLEPDGWTISTSDGKISGLFEETVAISESSNMVLTDPVHAEFSGLPKINKSALATP
jgi:methionyl aminopeptidase